MLGENTSLRLCLHLGDLPHLGISPQPCFATAVVLKWWIAFALNICVSVTIVTERALGLSWLKPRPIGAKRFRESCAELRPERKLAHSRGMGTLWGRSSGTGGFMFLLP